MWTVPDSPPPDPPTQGSDRAAVVGYLGWHRATLLHICGGLSAEQLVQRPLAPSQLSLAGLIRHLAKVERIWLSQRAAGRDVEPLYGGPGDPTDFVDLDPVRAESEIDQLRAEAVAGDAAVAGLPFDHPVIWRDETWSLRFTYLHLIGEYARHNGHADLVREAIDGAVGR